MKKVYGIVLMCLLLFVPSGVKGLSHKDAAKQMNDYMEKAIFSGEWKVSNMKNDKTSYTIKVLVGKTSNKKFKEVLDEIPYLSALNHDLYKSYAMVTDCVGSSKCDGSSFKNYMKFQLHAADKNGNVYIEADNVSVNAYNSMKGAKVYYQLTTNQKGMGGDVDKKGNNTLSGVTVDEDNVDKKQGKISNPYIIAPNGSIKIPSKNDSFWEGEQYKCVYYRVDYSSKTDEANKAARYKITPFESAQKNIYWANDPAYTLARGLSWDENPQKDGEVVYHYFQMHHKNTFAICDMDGSVYGKTFNFTFIDTKQALITEQRNQDAAIQNGEENVTNPDGSENKEIPDPMPGEDIDPGLKDKINQGNNACAIIGKETETYKLIQKIVGYVKIGTVFLVVVLGMLDLTGAVGSQDEGSFKKAGIRFGKRLLAGSLVFLVPAIVGILVGLISDQMNCNGLSDLKDVYNK